MKLSIGDSFQTIKDVMNNVFGWNYKSYFRGHYPLDDANKYSAWFPKLEKGPKEPGDVWYGWVNTLSSDGKYIYMNNYSEPMRMIKAKSKSIHITFTKKPGENYKYSGCFIRTHLDPELGWVFKRIEEDINVDDLHLIPKVAGLSN